MTRPLVLLVNGNSHEALTERMARLAREKLGAMMDVEQMTIAQAPPFVSSRAEAAHAASAILRAVHRRVSEAAKPTPNVIMLACFGEPGLLALRDMLPMPVTGMVEASVHTVLQLGRRVSILTSGRDWPAQIEDLLDVYG